MLEYKTNPIQQCELKFSDEDWRITGYASVFNSVDSYKDTILPGAFTKSLESGKDIKMYYEHLRYMKPGKWDVLAEDEKGLSAIGFLTREHSIAKDVRAELRHGTTMGMSIGFNIPPGGFEEKEDGGRIIKSIDLFEVSLTGSPAEPKATIDSFKSELETVLTIRDMEDFLRDVGNLSKSMTAALLGHMKSLCRSDSEQENAARMRELKTALELKALVDKYDISKLIA